MIFEKLKINEITLENRVVVAPMCQYSAIDGCAGPWHYSHLSQLAKSGAGLLMIESTSVSPDGRITNKDLCIKSKENINSLQKLFVFLKSVKDMPLGIQISHSGRKGSANVPWIKANTPLDKSSNCWQTVSASNIPRDIGWPKPKQLSTNEIKKITDDFTVAAASVDKIGFEALEVHMAHGYLLHQFFSPISNKRIDEYGGSLQNRSKFLLEIARKIREVWPKNKILGARVTGSDWLKNGATVDDCIFLTTQLKNIGFDYVCVSSGGILPITNLAFKPGYQTHLSKEVKENTGIITRTAGMITSAEQANDIIKNKSADLVAIARKFIQNPNWLYDHNSSIIPKQYHRCF
jgi:2,4-dienoyl-CoA reductase-like NADH-dependent reductase (Old Yellow Enzyme family)